MASRFDDLSVDGMNARIESVLSLSAGWNPVKDPSFQQGARLAETNPYLRGSFVIQSGYQYSFGNLLAAYLACLTGNLNAGKAVTPILAVASFGIAYGGLAALALPGGWCVALALLGVENLVVVDTKDAVLVCAKDKAQEVKRLMKVLPIVTGKQIGRAHV